MKTYSRRKLCRLCGSRKMERLGVLAAFPAFAGETLPETGPEGGYPVEWTVCTACQLLQNTHVVAPGHLFGQSPYRSRTLPGRIDILHRVQDVIRTQTDLPDSGFVIEVGAGDGILQEALAAAGYEAMGVDPSPATADAPDAIRSNTIREVFEAKVAATIRHDRGLADAILAIGVLPRIDNLHAFLAGVRYVLKDDGVLIFDLPYVSAIAAQSRIDWISHEMLSFPTLGAIQQFFHTNLMKLVNVVAEAGTPEHLLCVARKKETAGTVTNAVDTAIQHERSRLADDLKAIRSWISDLPQRAESARAFLAKARQDHGSLYGIGLDHGSWNTLHVLGLTPADLDGLLDDTPAYADGPVAGWPVTPLSAIETVKPGAVVLLSPDLRPGTTLDAHRKRGGKVLTLFPVPAIVDRA